MESSVFSVVSIFTLFIILIAPFLIPNPLCMSWLKIIIVCNSVLSSYALSPVEYSDPAEE